MKTAELLSKAVDYCVGLISPRRAARRTHFRRMERDPGYRELMLAMLRARGYRAASNKKGTTPWSGSGGSADAELLDNLPDLRNRARELERDDPLGSGLVGTFVRNVIGTGLRPQARTGDPQRDTQLEALWSERADALFPVDRLAQSEAQELLFRSCFVDGDVLIKEARRGAGEPLWCEAIEGDRLSDPLGQTQTIAAGHEVREGVERDTDGIPVAYWIRKHHPGDTLQVPRRGALDFERVPAELCNHLKITKRAGQSRGEPAFHAIMQDIRDLDLLLLASLKRVQIAACLSVFIKSATAVDDLLGVTAERYGHRLDQNLEPGMIFQLYPEEEIQTLIPNFPTPELTPFVILLARRIGAALGVSWQIVLKDFSDSTYSSARSDLLEARQVYQVLRAWFVGKCMNWLWQRVLSDARLRGDTRLAGVSDEELARVEWFGDGWAWVDPLKEVKSVQVELQAHITTLEEVWQRQGKDPQRQWKRLAAQKEKLDELGLTLERPATVGGAREVDIEALLEEERPHMARNDNGNRARIITATTARSDEGSDAFER